VAAIMHCTVAAERNFTAAAMFAMSEFLHAIYFTHNFQCTITVLCLSLILCSLMQSSKKSFNGLDIDCRPPNGPLIKTPMIRHEGSITCSEGFSLNKYSKNIFQWNSPK
jgi:hypothetical protein